MNADALLHIALIEPEIPPNTGNVARLCAAFGCHLHLVGPLGFKLDDAALRRAGMDYWRFVRWTYHDSLEALLRCRAPGSRTFCVETEGSLPYYEARFARGDFLIFGRETKGLSRADIQAAGGECLAIPLLHPEARSLNLSNCVAIVASEALRQLGYPGSRGVI